PACARLKGPPRSRVEHLLVMVPQPLRQGPRTAPIFFRTVRERPLFACAVRRRRFPVGESPTRRTLQPEATGAVMEVGKLRPLGISTLRDRVCELRSRPSIGTLRLPPRAKRSTGGGRGGGGIYIDAGSMMFVTNPERCDVMVTENVFGDIASEIAAGVVGGLGVAPSADVSETHGVFQPSHCSAPDIAGKGAANLVATILSAAMMLDWLSDKRGDERCAEAAASIRTATGAILETGPKTRDLGGSAGMVEVTQAIRNAL